MHAPILMTEAYLEDEFGKISYVIEVRRKRRIAFWAEA